MTVDTLGKGSVCSLIVEITPACQTIATSG
jgi:hypothetical protein